MHDHNIYRSSNTNMASSDHIFPRYFVCTDTIFLQCEKQNACVTSFWSADPFLGGPRLPPEEVSARLKFLGPRTLNFAFIRQKLGVPCPKKWVRVPKFKRAVPIMTVV